MRLGTVKTALAYVFLLGLCVLTFWATNAAESLWALLLVVVIGALCVGDSTITSRCSDLSFELRRTLDEARPLDLVATLKTPWFIMPSRIEVDVVIDNRLFGTHTSTTLVLRSVGNKPQTFTYSYPEFACGKVDVRVERVLFFDSLGFTQVERKVDFKQSRLVYPRSLVMKLLFDRSPQSAYSGATFDKFKKGTDRSETLDLRSYNDGDDPREVHWKLSARIGELLVREPSRPTDYNVALVFGLGRYFEPGLAGADVYGAAGDREGDETRQEKVPVDVKALDRAISLFTSLSNEMVNGGVGHMAALPDADHLRLQTVDTRQGWGSMVDTMLSLPLPDYAGHSIDLFVDDPACAHFTKVVLVASEINEEALRRMSERVDVTVFFVGDVGLTQGESIANCDVVSIAPDQLEGRVETLSV